MQRLQRLSFIPTENLLLSCRTSMKRLCMPSLTCSAILRAELESRSTWQFKAGNRWTNYWSRHWRTTTKWTRLWTLYCSMMLCSMCESILYNNFLEDWLKKYSRNVVWPIRWKFKAIVVLFWGPNKRILRKSRAKSWTTSKTVLPFLRLERKMGISLPFAQFLSF